LESLLPPLLSENVSWISGLLWFAIAYYLGNPAPNEKPFAAFARALGCANESELNAAIEKNRRDLSIRLHSAEDRVYARFGTYYLRSRIARSSTMPTRQDFGKV
jgi:hypothetical protein